MAISENPRIDELRRRVEKDPTSIAFAQLAEEHRRIGEYEEAVKVCRDGLARHPGYVSAQVTLGRALMELEQFDEARNELEAVLSVAPDNLAAIRALADIHQRRGDVGEAINLHAAAASEPEPEEPAEQPALTLDVPLLEDIAPVDFSLDATMPTFDESETTEPGAVSAAPSTELPALTADDLPSLEALEALTLDLPPLPDFSDWSLDATLTLDLPSLDFSDLPAARQEIDPALDELEGWLAAIVADRSQSR